MSGDGNEYVSEYRVFTPNGDVRWISAVAEIERDAQGKPLRMVGAHIDITALKQTELALAEHTQKLEEADRRKDEFLAMLGHELRSPLAAIVSMAEFLKRSAPGTLSDFAHAHAVIARQSSHLGVPLAKLHAARVRDSIS